MRDRRGERTGRPSSVFAVLPVELDLLERQVASEGAGPTDALVRSAANGGAGQADDPDLALRRLARVVLRVAEPTRTVAVRLGLAIWTLETRGANERFVCCYSLEREGRAWLVRRREERDGPEAVDCPLAFLAAVSETHTNGRRVRAYHEAEVAEYEVLV